MELDLVEEIVPLQERELTILRPRSSEALLDEEAFEHEEFLPYWAELWPSGVALARTLSGRALRGARTLELGCGLALPSIAAALSGGRVLATETGLEARYAITATDKYVRVRVTSSLGECAWSQPFFLDGE